jgi:hypothetical protein
MIERVVVLTILSLCSGVQVRFGRSKQIGGQLITVPDIWQPGSPDSYSGVNYQGGSSGNGGGARSTPGVFSLDPGASAFTLGTTRAPGALVFGYNAPDYGMKNPTFQAPAVSNTVPLNNFSPPNYVVVGCNPSAFAAGRCSQSQMSNYNLGVRNQISATPFPRH